MVLGFVFFARPIGEARTYTMKLNKTNPNIQMKTKTHMLMKMKMGIQDNIAIRAQMKTKTNMLMKMKMGIRDNIAIRAQMEKIATRQRERAETLVRLKMLAASRAELAAPFRLRQALHDKHMSDIDKLFDDDESPY